MHLQKHTDLLKYPFKTKLNSDSLTYINITIKLHLDSIIFRIICGIKI